jgi:hypothetical protein
MTFSQALINKKYDSILHLAFNISKYRVNAYH